MKHPILTILCLMWLALPLAGQPVRPTFTQLNADNGLPNNFVMDIFEDRDGLVWVATPAGLSRYNGHTWRTYLPHVVDSTDQLAKQPFIWDIYEDAAGQLWLGTATGLFLFDKRTGRGTRFGGWKKGQPAVGEKRVDDILATRAGELCLSMSGGVLCTRLRDSTSTLYRNANYAEGTQLLEDEDGRVWAAAFGGLYRCAAGDTLRYTPMYNAAGLQPDVYCAFRDGKSRYWIGTNAGLYRFHPATGRADFVDVGAGGVYEVYAIEQADDGALYIGTGQSGVLVWNPDSGTITNHYQAEVAEQEGIATNFVFTLYPDRHRNLWIGTNGGLSILHAERGPARLLAYPGGKKNPANEINIRLVDSQKNWWFSHDRNDLTFRKSSTTERLDTARWVPPLAKSQFYFMAEDRQGYTWYATPLQGLYRAAPNSVDFVRVKDLSFFGGKGPKQMVADKGDANQFWIVTENGLCRFHTQTYDTLWVRPTEVWLQARNDVPWRLVRHPDGSLWFFNSMHLCRYQPADGTFAAFAVPGKHPPGNFAFGYIADMGWSGNVLYMATQGGLLLFDRVQEQFQLLAATPAGDDLRGLNNLLIAPDGTVWVSRKRQLLALAPDTGQFKVLDAQAWCSEFSLSAAYILPEGRLAFGTRCGLLVVDATAIQARATAPKVVLSQFLVRNQPIASDVDPVFMEGVELPHSDNFFTIEYTALDYTKGASVAYRYKLEGLSPDWVMAGAERSVTFANLPPGRYRFVAEALGADGASGTPLVLPIYVRPAFWQTGWFRVAVLALLLAIGYLVFRAWRNTRRLEEEKRVAEQNARYKSKFLSSVSHELRTPLNAILGINGLLMDTRLDLRQQYFTDSIHLSCEKLLAIINDLLDQAKIESGKFSLRPQLFDLRQLVGQIERLMAHQFTERGITLRVDYAVGVPEHFVGDAVRLFQILMNLVGNAAKFTRQGQVVVRVAGQPSAEEAGTFVLAFEVQDTGIGIPADKLGDVFKDFEQIDHPAELQVQGTGLGLSIAKELVEMHGGRIHVRSALGEGTTFAFTLPLPLGTEIPAAATEEPQVALPAGLRILIVDDTPINQFLTAEILKKHLPDVQIDTAANGEIAVAKTAARTFDLVFMDVRMPVVDGMEATRLIRQNPALGRLPIVGLTSDAVTTQMEACTAAGMNDCLSKPVRPAALLGAVTRWVGGT